MGTHWYPSGGTGRPMTVSLFAGLKHWLGVGWHSHGAAPAASEAQPLHHHERFSVEELDAEIENSLRSGSVDLAAAREAVHRQLPTPAPAQSAPPEPPSVNETTGVKAFGGDLYPTAAHGFEPGARFVRVHTWGSGTNRA